MSTMATIWSNRQIDVAFDQSPLLDDEYAIRSLDDDFRDVWMTEDEALEMARGIIRHVERKRKANQ